MKKFLIISAVIVVIFLTIQIYFTMAKTETQPYQVIKKEKDYEIRRYPSATIATISLDAKSYKELSSSGFRKLASFIFGGNQSKKKHCHDLASSHGY